MEFFAVMLVVAVCGIIGGVKSGKKGAAGQTQNMRLRKKASAVPNQPRKLQRAVKQRQTEDQVCSPGRACSYEAAYSKGRPERIGQRGDYDPVTPRMDGCGSDADSAALKILCRKMRRIIITVIFVGKNYRRGRLDE